MKKTLMLMVVAMLTIASVFAADGAATAGAPATTPGVDKKVTASLELTNEHFAGYSFGFSSSAPDLGDATNNDVTNVAEDTGVIITYTSGGEATSSGDAIYYYYKVRTNGTVTLTMKADLLKKAGALSTTLGYKVTGAGTEFNSEKSVSRDGTELMNVVIKDGFGSDSGLMTFTLTGLDAGDIGSYTAAITYNIVSA